jgi:hypothetical protein
MILAESLEQALNAIDGEMEQIDSVGEDKR